MAKNESPKIVLDVAYQPQVRTNMDTRRIMLNVMLALLPSLLAATYEFGFKPVLMVIVSMCSAVFYEWAYRRLLKKSSTIFDFSACLTGMLVAITLPTSAPWWLPLIGNFFAIVIVKQLYGGLGKNFVNPALASRAFLIASYAGIMTNWVSPRAMGLDAVAMATPMSYLYAGEPMPDYYSYRNLFLGIMPGCFGEACKLALILGGLYLIIRKIISWRIPVSYIGTVAILTFAFGHEGYDNFSWMMYNILSGSLILAAFFMATDYATSPVTLPGQLLYGVGCGALTVLIRYFGSYPEGVTYSILIMNICTWAIDKAFRRHQFGVTKEDIAAEKAAKKAAKEAAK
ncbi:MAG: RnfABCDGE type electron transport complex subunit D [Oscillospiraceae bacterium]|nr:RnfABCDGE type electron transport complex subunit D [Oscillospiraceae bacterium]